MTISEVDRLKGIIRAIIDTPFLFGDRVESLRQRHPRICGEKWEDVIEGRVSVPFKKFSRRGGQ